MRMLPSLRSAPLYKKIYDLLVQQMMDGNIPAGARLNESDLSARLEVSRTPVREALRALEADGWVEGRKGSGYVVFSPSLQDFIELSECRTALEGIAAKKMAEHATEEEIAELENILLLTRDALENNNEESVLSLNQRFHQHIVACSRNRHLVKLLDPLKKRIFIYRYLLNKIRRSQSFFPEHEAVFRAIRERDGKGAEEAMIRHLTNDRRHLEQHYSGWEGR